MKVTNRYAWVVVLLLVSLSGWAFQDITFKSGEIELAGTLYTPKGDGPFPAIVFVHGSGPETRDNSKYSAKWLQSIGYIALAYDKRGTGESGGDPESVNRFDFNELANDAVAAVNYLAGLQNVDKAKIGLHAGSQGGWVASLAASKSRDISFMVVKSASVCTVEEDRIFERSARLASEGFSKEQIEEAQIIQKAEPLRKGGSDNFAKLFEQFKNKDWFKRVYLGDDPNSESLTSYRKWYGTIADFDPLPYLSKLEVPVFWIFGDPDLDKLGPVELSISNLQNFGSDKFKILQIDGQSHNIKERAYELQLYEWLSEVNDWRGYKFRKH